MSAAAHLAIAPIVLPLATAGIMVLLDERRRVAKARIALAAAVALVAVAAALAFEANHGMQVYRVGDWPAPFGIVLAVDRLSAAMVLLASVLGLAALVHSLARWNRAGPYFHSLVQLLMAGLNGAFLTGDLFNLFVFFELLLAASYGLALHGSGTARVRASLHYIAINLVASLLFLVGVSLIYGISGTLNMADLALRQVPAGDRVLLEIGVATMAIAFLVKAGMWPLGFWLEPTYASASAPSAALFAILSKVGIYAVMRVWLVVLGGAPGADFLVGGGIATLAFGTIGMVASQEPRRLASCSLLVSSGTLLAVCGVGGENALGAAIYYLFASTLGVASFFLVAELVERVRAAGADILAVTADAFGITDEEGRDEDETPGAAIPGAMAALAFAFAGGALVIAGLPPLPGFVGKFAMLSSLLARDAVPPSVWVVCTLVLVSGLAAIVGIGRAGVRIFWAGEGVATPKVRLAEMLPVAALIALCAVMVVAAGPAMRYTDAAAHALHARAEYVREVLGPP